MRQVGNGGIAPGAAEKQPVQVQVGKYLYTSTFEKLRAVGCVIKGHRQMPAVSRGGKFNDFGVVMRPLDDVPDTPVPHHYFISNTAINNPFGSPMIATKTMVGDYGVVNRLRESRVPSIAVRVGYCCCARAARLLPL